MDQRLQLGVCGDGPRTGALEPPRMRVVRVRGAQPASSLQPRGQGVALQRLGVPMY